MKRDRLIVSMAPEVRGDGDRGYSEEGEGVKSSRIKGG
jgi:hypothetical protein